MAMDSPHHRAVVELQSRKQRNADAAEELRPVVGVLRQLDMDDLNVVDPLLRHQPQDATGFGA